MQSEPFLTYQNGRFTKCVVSVTFILYYHLLRKLKQLKNAYCAN